MSVRIRALTSGKDSPVTRRIVRVVLALLVLAGLVFAFSQSEPRKPYDMTPSSTGTPSVTASATATVTPVAATVTESATSAPDTTTASATAESSAPSTTATLPSVSAPPVAPPAEDDPGFNPCTQGVDGTYPPEDPRYKIPGPCNLGTPLPYGARFRVELRPWWPVTRDVCGGWAPVTVAVMVVAPDGRSKGERVASGCAPAAAPLTDGVGHPLLVADLYREAATLYA